MTTLLTFIPIPTLLLVYYWSFIEHYFHHATIRRATFLLPALVFTYGYKFRHQMLYVPYKRVYIYLLWNTSFCVSLVTDPNLAARTVQTKWPWTLRLWKGVAFTRTKNITLSVSGMQRIQYFDIYGNCFLKLSKPNKLVPIPTKGGFA